MNMLQFTYSAEFPFSYPLQELAEIVLAIPWVWETCRVCTARVSNNKVEGS